MNETHTILLVDDSQNDLLLLRRAFRKAEFNSRLQDLHNGEEAIAYLRADGPYGDRVKFPPGTAMLLDLNMPKKNGFDVLEWRRSQPQLKSLPIIILTASRRMEDVERAFDLGANSFLVKPSAMEDLTAMIRCLRDWLQLNHFPPGNHAVVR
jgi:CheY-like chemotaxis protein